MKRLFLALLAVSILSFALFLVFLPGTYLYDGALHLGLLSLAMYYLWKKDLATTLKGMGFPGSFRTTALYTVGGLLAIFAMLFLLGILAMHFGFNDQANVTQKIDNLPLYILALAVIFAPLTEELLFRALLVPRFGIVISALLFGALHFSYGSVVEVIGVTLVGVLLGFVYQRSRSITPCLLIHLVYNLLSIVAMKMMT